jgi:hypothetical protein
MTATATVQKPRVYLDLPVDIEPTDGGLTVRWDGGREVTLPGNPNQLQDYLEALQFCYEAGFADASNPRLFVP